MLFQRFFNILRANLNSGSTSGEYENEQFHKQSFRESTETTKVEPMNKIEAEYYANLELKPGAGFEEVKTAYKRLMKLYHPDRHQGSEEQRKVAELITRRLNEAYKYFENKFQVR